MDKTAPADSSPTIPQRRHDVDRLRVLAMGTIFLFHCARFFDHEGWHVKNPVSSHAADIFVVFVAQWIMPLFFILSAYGTFFALGHRTPAQFIKERFFRLVVPFVFGVFVLIPPQVYIERHTQGEFMGSFIDFYPHYFDGMYGFGGNFAWMGLHLWYLEMLFVFSLLMLPLFLRLRGRAAGGVIRREASRYLKPGYVALLCLPLFFMELFVNAFPESFGIRAFGGWSPFTYLVFFIIGFVIASDDRFAGTFERYRAAWLILGIATTTIGLFLIETHVLDGLPRPATLPIEAALRALNSWFWLSAIMGFGHRYFTSSGRAQGYANEAVLPFYILHQTVIVIVAYFLIGWGAPLTIKYAVLAAASFAIIMAVYKGLVKRIGISRFLFGMKAAQK